jgi:hypothetical protein
VGNRKGEGVKRGGGIEDKKYHITCHTSSRIVTLVEVIRVCINIRCEGKREKGRRREGEEQKEEKSETTPLHLFPTLSHTNCKLK